MWVNRLQNRTHWPVHLFLFSNGCIHLESVPGVNIVPQPFFPVLCTVPSKFQLFLSLKKHLKKEKKKKICSLLRLTGFALVSSFFPQQETWLGLGFPLITCLLSQESKLKRLGL